MSTITENQKAVAVGTWQLDQVHSGLGFAVDYMAGTFRRLGGAVRGKPDGLGRRHRETRRLGPGRGHPSRRRRRCARTSPHRSSSTPSGRPTHHFASAPFDPTRERVAIAGTLEIKGVALPVQLTGSLGGPVVDPYGGERINLALETTVDRARVRARLERRAPERRAALAHDVTLTAELALVKAAYPCDPRHLRQPARGLVQHGAPPAAGEARPAGSSSSSGDGLKEVPPFDEDDEPSPRRAVADLRAAIAGADAVLIATPEYNGSLPGQLKNALDWASRPHAHEPVPE